jgi:uncharacterized membrane protein YbjE (DUF340 family)
MPSEDLAVSLLVHTAKVAGIKIDNNMHHTLVNKSLLMTAWIQVLGGLLGGFGFIYWLIKRRKK